MTSRKPVLVVGNGARSAGISEMIYQFIEKTHIPVLATMNTADQNVFTLDTAFQRRWNMKQIENNFDKSEHSKDIIAGK